MKKTFVTGVFFSCLAWVTAPDCVNASEATAMARIGAVEVGGYALGSLEYLCIFGIFLVLAITIPAVICNQRKDGP